MQHDRNPSEDNLFVQQVRETGKVWGLLSKHGWAYCASDEYEDTDVLLFWSDRARAQWHAKAEWTGHKPTPIPLQTFIDQWLRGMHEDGALVGLNWDGDLCGLEVEPRELAELLVAED